MTARTQWAIVAGVVLALALGLWVAVRTVGDELFPVGAGTAAPAFMARTLDDPARPKGLADYEGEVVLLNVWATWCGPCRVEMPGIEALHRAYAPHGLKVVAVSVDQEGDADKIRDFVREYGLTFEVLHQPSGEIQGQYQTTGVPETFVIGRDGTIRKKVIGATHWDSPANRALVAELLGVATVAAPAPAGPDAPAAVAVPAGAGR